MAWVAKPSSEPMNHWESLRGWCLQCLGTLGTSHVCHPQPHALPNLTHPLPHTPCQVGYSRQKGVQDWPNGPLLARIGQLVSAGVISESIMIAANS